MSWARTATAPVPAALTKLRRTRVARVTMAEIPGIPGDSKRSLKAMTTAARVTPFHTFSKKWGKKRRTKDDPMSQFDWLLNVAI